MTSFIRSFDVKETRVSILIPFAFVSVFAIAQLFLGCDPIILILSVTGILVTFLPLHFNGRDLYSLCAITVGIRWIGAALIFKTLYGQPLQTHLFAPVASYAWALGLMVLYTLVFMLVRALDSGRDTFSFPDDPQGLRRLSLVAFGLGSLGFVLMSGANGDGEGGGASGFAISTLKDFLLFGFVAESARNLSISNGRKLFGPFLILMLLLVFLAGSATNTRGFFLDCVVAVAVVAFLYKAIRVKYVVLGLLFVAFFSGFVSPVILYLRAERGLPLMQFVETGGRTAWKAATDPAFLRIVKNVIEEKGAEDAADRNYDYYGDRSNIGNRLSYIALFDRVYLATRNLNPLGIEELTESTLRALPKALGFDKSPTSMGDWLAWRVGMLDQGMAVFINFGLPMEGLATWGWIGAVSYPFIFIFPWLFLNTKIASFRRIDPASIFIFALIQHDLVEQNSDSLMSGLFKGIPLLFCFVFAIRFLFFFDRPGVGAKGAPVEA